MPHNRKVTLPVPRCPFCYEPLEEVQIRIGELGPEECWGCKSCRTNHVFPARIDFLKHLGLSRILETNERILHTPHSFTN